MRRIFTPLALAIIALAIPQGASACSCIGGFETIDDQFLHYFEWADVVMEATVVEEEKNGRLRTYAVSLEKLWKGQADAYAALKTPEDSAACGIFLEPQETYVIFAQRSDGKLHTGLCSGTVHIAEAADLLDWLHVYEGNGIPTMPKEVPENTDCALYQCANGDEFPACTDQGHFIAYFAPPCEFSGGDLELIPDDEAIPLEELLKAPEEFLDVPQGHPNYAAIMYVRNEGIVQGYDDLEAGPRSLYKPDQLINRAEFTKIIIEAVFAEDEIDSCESGDLFSDVFQKEWYADYVCLAKAVEVIGGYPDGTFKPGSLVNFAEAAKIVVNAFGIETDPEDHLGIWWRPFVFGLARIGGLPTSFTDPNQFLTRGDMAEIIYRVMKGMKH